MSAESPPAFLQAGSYGAEQTRRAIASLLARGASIGSILGGLVNAGDCALSPPGSGMSVNVAPGELWVPGTTSSTQSGYYCRISSSTSLSIAAADPTNPRIDTVVAQVQDAAYAGSVNSFAPAVVTGTPTAGATLANLNGKGAVPASSYVLGYVLVPANATNIVSGDLLEVGGAAALGMQPSAGAVQISASQSTSSTTFTTLGTPDEITGIVLPTDGLIAVWYQAAWQESVGNAAAAAIFLNSNQVEIQGHESTDNVYGPFTQSVEIQGGGDFGVNVPLFTCSAGLGSLQPNSSGAGGNDVTTGQIVGAVTDALSGGQGSMHMVLGGTHLCTLGGILAGPCYIFAAAGTYTVSIQFKASSGSVTASNRKLWVQALSF